MRRPPVQPETLLACAPRLRPSELRRAVLFAGTGVVASYGGRPFVLELDDLRTSGALDDLLEESFLSQLVDSSLIGKMATVVPPKPLRLRDLPRGYCATSVIVDEEAADLPEGAFPTRAAPVLIRQTGSIRPIPSSPNQVSRASRRILHRAGIRCARRSGEYPTAPAWAVRILQRPLGGYLGRALAVAKGYPPARYAIAAILENDRTWTALATLEAYLRSVETVA